MSIGHGVSEQTFIQKFGRRPKWIFRAPGRINLIGEHTDYTGGFVFPLAIDREIEFAVDISDSGFTNAYSVSLGDGVPFDQNESRPSSKGLISDWTDYLQGVAWALKAKTERPLSPLDVVVTSDLPMGSGVSSSAALEVGIGAAWNIIDELGLSPTEIALASQNAENNYVGVNSGIMDQLASAVGRAGQAIFIDTRSLQFQYGELPAGTCVALCDTRAPRRLVGSKYNDRRNELETAEQVLGDRDLRDVTIEELMAAQGQLDDVCFRRAKHVITENSRCLAFKGCLETGDRAGIFRLMQEAHISMRDDFEATSPELDAMAEAAWLSTGCVGARMTGGGFGGSCVAIVDADLFENFKSDAEALYMRKSDRKGSVEMLNAVDGAGLLQIL